MFVAKICDIQLRRAASKNAHVDSSVARETVRAGKIRKIVSACSRIAILLTAALVTSSRFAAAQVAQPFVAAVDLNMTIAAGTLDLLSIQRAAAAIEDRWLPPSRFSESTPARRALGIGYRFGKWFGLDLPQDHMLMVVAHEVFGHGARLREIDVQQIGYAFDLPIPYGPGGAVTYFDGDGTVTRADILAIDTGGIEAQNVLADWIRRRAIAGGVFHYREAWLYFESRLAGLRYIRSVSPRSAEGHDVKSFLDDFNEGCERPSCAPLSAATLKQYASFTLADPLLGYAGYAWAWSYLVRGRSSATLPMIPLTGGIRYLPALRFEMTPYGTAFTTEHTFMRQKRLTTITVGVGNTGGNRAWDIGVNAADVLRTDRVDAGVTMSVWQQPALDSGPGPQLLEIGGLGAASLRIPIARNPSVSGRAGVFLHVGYKSDGFVRGERLHAAPIFRVGLTFRP